MRKLIISFVFLIPSVNSFSQVFFEDVANQLGANYNYGSISLGGGGVSFADFNNDGWDDLTYSTDDLQEIHFLENNSGTFTKINLQGIDYKSTAKQVVWADYDNDGDKDLFVTYYRGNNKLYQNNGNMSFTDISDTCGIFTADLFSSGGSFGDYDNDGDLDLLITNLNVNSDNRNYLYRNDNGSFVDVTQSSGISMTSELSFCGSFFDYNNDGFQDIYIANDQYANANLLYKNNGDGTFEDVSITSGAGISIAAMSTTIGDYNNDGWFDIYVTNDFGGNYLLKNNGDGTFTDVAMSQGVVFSSIAWGAVFLDGDNDSNLDLYVSGSLDGSNSSFLSSAYYLNDGNNAFSIPSGIGFSNDFEESYGNAIGDFNNDGYPDIVVMNSAEDYFLWENKTQNTNNWVKIKLEGVTGNKDGIGNRIEVHAGGKSQYRYTVCGEGYLGQNSNYEFVGVGAATNIDYIKITWNKTGIVETITNVSPNQAITVQEGNGIVLSTKREELNSFSVYPNPSLNGQFNFSITNNEPHQITIFDLSGRLLLRKEEVHSSRSLDLSNLSSGVYLAKVISGKKSKVVKLIRN